MSLMKSFGGVFNLDNDKEKAIFEYYNRQYNKSQYLKRLISEDMQKRKPRSGAELKGITFKIGD